MGLIIKDLKIQLEDYYYNTDEEILKNLSKINIFIGENNTGKSRFLRSIFNSFENKLEFYHENNEINDKLKNYNTTITDISKELEKLNDSEYYIEFKSLIHILKSSDEKYLSEGPNFKKFSNLLDYIASKKKKLKKLEESGSVDNEDYIYMTTLDDIKNRISEAIEPKEIEKYVFNLKKFYIPTLRGLRPLKSENKNLTENLDPKLQNGLNDADLYKKRTISDYFKNNENEVCNYIFTGFDYYNILAGHLRGKYEQREMLENLEQYLKDNFFDRQEVKLFAALGSDVISVKIGKEDEKYIYNLGDGIQTIILILLPLFLHYKKIKDNENVLVCIDEPEQHLHPTLQKKLINAFHDPLFKNFQFFFTTHSNHFLDSIIDYNNTVSVYNFRKEIPKENDESNEMKSKFCISPLKGNEVAILNDLGVSLSSVLLQNCNILLEGASDKPYYRKYLEIYMGHDKKLKKYEEGTHYIFDTYGGTGNIEEKLKIIPDSLNDKIQFIADEDGNRADIEKKLKNAKCKYILNCKEVENTLSKETIYKIFEMHSAIKNEDIDKDFCKEELIEDKYKNEKMAKLLDKCVSKTNLFSIGENTKGKRPDDFRDKVGFAGLAMRNVECYDDLSKEAEKIAEKMYKFIEKKNS